MEIDNQTENQRNINALQTELERTGTSISVFKTMLYKHELIGNVKFPPLIIQGFNIVEFERRMMSADWTHMYSDDGSVRMQGAAEVRNLLKDIEVLGKDPEGNRVAFYLCNRWIPDNTYGAPDSILSIEDELKVALKDPAQQANYEKLNEKIQYNSYFHPVLDGIITMTENFKEVVIPPLVINGIDVVDLECHLFEANCFAESLNSIGDYPEVLAKFKPLFKELETLSQTDLGRSLALIYWSTYARNIATSKIFKSAYRNHVPDVVYSDYFELNSEYLKNKEMNVNDLNFSEEDVKRIGEVLKYQGLKEVPRELIVDMLVKNKDKSVIEWKTREDHLASDVDLYFKKSNDKQYLNGYAVSLSEEGKQFFRRYNRIDYGNTLTYKQTVNMAQGRAICRDWIAKDETGKAGERYSAAAMFDFDDKDTKGNVKIVQYRDFDVPALLSRYPFDFSASEKAKEYFLGDVMRGNLSDCSLITGAGPEQLQTYLNARENKMVFQRPGGKEVDVTVKGNVATIRDPDLVNEKKNDLTEGKKTGQSTGKGKGKTNQGPVNKGTTKTRGRKPKGIK